MATEQPNPQTAPEEAAAPKLSASEFRTYNRMAETMDYYVSSASPLRGRETNAPIAQPFPNHLETDV